MGSVEVSIIVPTLNEAEHIGRLLASLQLQSTVKSEVILVDGGSQDGTVKIARSLGAKVFVLEGAGEWDARNYGVVQSTGYFLVFTCADVIFPPDSLESALRQFRENSSLAALTGPDFPYDGGPILPFIYGLYNALRFLSSKLPYPYKTFSSSTNFLVVRKGIFSETGGFNSADGNADGTIGRYLVSRYQTIFDNRVRVYISARRAKTWGIARFTHHYLYVLENFLPGISRKQWFQSLKSRSRKSHGEIHGKPPASS
ncbi:MAG TPA: glycosyltransferase [Candidatus Angelobacter sp.]|nr:glycosyltransferase [Candidatus Angelobacter sp.]